MLWLSKLRSPMHDVIRGVADDGLGVHQLGHRRNNRNTKLGLRSVQSNVRYTLGTDPIAVAVKSPKMIPTSTPRIGWLINAQTRGANVCRRNFARCCVIDSNLAKMILRGFSRNNGTNGREIIGEPYSRYILLTTGVETTSCLSHRSVERRNGNEED